MRRAAPHVPPRRALLSACGAVAAAGGACYPEPLDFEERDVPVVAVLDGEDLSLRAGELEARVESDPPREKDLPDPAQVVTYEFVDARGDVLREGVLPDPRHLRAEWQGDDGQMGGTDELVGEGAAGVWVPGERGEVRVYESYKADGDEPIATAPYEPGAAAAGGTGSLSRSLASFSDLRQTPSRLWGSAAHSDAINILFVPDGFRQGELDRFRAAAEETMVDMFDEKPDFGAYAHRFNAWYMEIPSVDSGISRPEEGIERTTAFESYINEHNALRNPVLARGAASYVRRRWGMDVVAIVVNETDTRIRGSRIGSAVRMTMSSRKHHTFAHELGHALYGLADEYVYEPSCGFRRRLINRTRPNVDNTTSRSRIDWSHLIEESTPLPTPEGTSINGAGAFEGAGTCEDGWYRAQETCLMRSSLRDMCDVCREEMDRVMGGI